MAALSDQDLVKDSQRNAVKAVCDAVTALNKSLELAGQEGIHIELMDTNSLGDRNARYIVQKHELRIMVLPPAGGA